MRTQLLLTFSIIALSCFLFYFFQFRKFELQIALQPLGEVKETYLKLVEAELERYYFCEVEILPSMELPKTAFYAPRNRYRADRLIEWLQDFRPSQFHKIMGFTEKDISTTKGDVEDWGVLGLAYLGGKSCVISTFRSKRNASETKAKDRIIKNALHEIGHTLGLRHCDFSKTCFMNDAKGTVKQVDLEKRQLCTECAYEVSRFLRVPR